MKVTFVKKQKGLLIVWAAILLIAIVLVGSPGCGNPTSQIIWIAVPQFEYSNATLSPAELVIELLATLEPSSQVGLIVGLENGDIVKVNPVPAGKGISSIKETLDALQRQGLPEGTGSFLSAAAGLNGNLLILAPTGFVQDVSREIGKISRSGLHIYIVSPPTLSAQALAQATDGRVFAPETYGNQEMAIVAAATSAIGRGLSQVITSEPAHRFSVSEGDSVVAAIPSARWDLLETTRPTQPARRWNFDGTDILIIDAPGDYTLLSSARVTVANISQPTSSGASNSALIWIPVCIFASSVVIIGCLYCFRGSQAKSVIPNQQTVLLIDKGDGQGTTETLVNKNLTMGNGLHPESDEWTALDLPGTPPGQVAAEWHLLADRLQFVPYVPAAVNDGPPQMVSQTLNVGDCVRIGATTIIVNKIGMN